jgi:hypothetical protein
MNNLFAFGMEGSIEFPWWFGYLYYLFLMAPFLLIFGAVLIIIFGARIVRKKPYNKRAFIILFSLWSALLLWFGWTYFSAWW